MTDGSEWSAVNFSLAPSLLIVKYSLLEVILVLGVVIGDAIIGVIGENVRLCTEERWTPLDPFNWRDDLLVNVTSTSRSTERASFVRGLRPCSEPTDLRLRRLFEDDDDPCGTEG